MDNNWVYSDYKGLEIIWLPGYHYLISAVMFGWGRFDLLPAHVVNMILGSMACGLMAWLISDVTSNWLAGLGAGVTLALMPWHIAYSHMNMPEVMAGLLLLGLLLAAYKDWPILLPILGFVGSLTRHELTLAIFIIGVWLWVQRGWLVSLRLWLGSGIALAGWSWWSWYRTGEFLGWWSRSVMAAAHDATFNRAAGSRLADVGTLVETVNQAYPLLPVICLTGVMVLVGICCFRWHYDLPRYTWLLIAVLATHWVVLGRSFVNGYLPVADPRFVLITLPALVGIGIIVIMAIPQPALRWATTAIAFWILFLSLFKQIPEFSRRAYVTHPEKAAGEYLATIAAHHGSESYWVDAPTAIYYSQLDPKRFFSSNKLLAKTLYMHENGSDIALAAIKEEKIRYVLWEDVSYTFVGQIWPQMSQAIPFEQNGYHFEPVFHYSGWELEYGAKPTSLWQVTELYEGEDSR
ncbi:MAG: hypothetical protein AAF702_45070 [Chloroflexota bacterium]